MIYVIKEEDSILREKIIKKILREHNFDYEFLDVIEFKDNLINLFSIAQTKSFLQDKRIILVNNAIFLDKEKNLNKEQWESLHNFIKTFNKQNNDHIIFVPKKKMNLSEKNVKEFISKVSVREMEKYSNGDIENLIRNILTKKNIKYENNHIHLIMKKCNFNLIKIENEIKKIALYNKDLTNELIDAIVTNYDEESIWEFLNLFFSKDKEMLKKYMALQKEGVDDYSLISLMANELNLMSKISIDILNKKNREDIISDNKITGFRFSKIKARLDTLSFLTIKDMILELYDLDKKIKYSNLDPKIVFKEFLLKNIL